MSTDNQDFDAESLFSGNSALGIENPAFSDQRKAGKNAVAIADIEDALLLASKYTTSELAQITSRTRTQTENTIKTAITKIAKFRNVDRAEIKSAFDAAQQANGVHLRRFRETSVVGAVGDPKGRSMGLAPFPLSEAAPAQDGTVGEVAHGVMGLLEDVSMDVQESVEFQQEVEAVPEPTQRDEQTPGPIATAVMLISQGQHQAARNVLAAHGML